VDRLPDSSAWVSRVLIPYLAIQSNNTGPRRNTGFISCEVIQPERIQFNFRRLLRSKCPLRNLLVSSTINLDRLHSNTLRQWDVLEKRLSLPGQDYIALKDRPTLADLSYFPFAMPWMFSFLSVDIKDWPNIEAWSKRMLGRSAVQNILARAPTFGH
jgi:glutathione S-transferase